MSYKCAHCGGRHNRADKAQQCADENRHKTGDYGLTDAHYLVTANHANDGPVDIHVQLKTVRGGRWDGLRIVNVYDADGKPVGVSLEEDRQTLLDLIRRGGFRSNMWRYGKQTGLCPICNENLTNEKERADGLHKKPECYTVAFG